MKNLKKILISIGKFILDLFLRVIFVFRDLGLGLWRGLIAIKNACVKFVKRFIDGSIWTKLSHLIMGLGNIARGQIVKGVLFLGLQILFITFMVVSPKSTNTPLGAKAIENFFTLGEYHGMPIDTTFDFEKEFTAIVSLPSSNFSSEYKTEVEKVYRLTNIFDAISDGDEKVSLIENDGRLNDKGREIYKSKEYSNVIYDDRFNTNDYYGYASYKCEPTCEIKVGDGSLVWIESKNEIAFNNLSDFVVASKDSTTLGLYQEKLEDGYRYLVIVKLTGKGDTLTLSNFANDVKICKVDYDVNYVELDVDFSLLMLLFGIITFAAIGVFIIVYNLSIASSYKTDKDILEGNKPTSFIEDIKSLLDSRFHLTLLSPAIILLVIFTVVPTIMMILIAFTDMSSNTASSGQVLINWTGFENFVALFSGASSSGSQIATEVGQNFASVLTWTFEWAILATFSCYFGGIFLALLINKKDVKLKKMWRTIFILTIAIPQFITLLILRNLLSGNGPINTMLLDLGIIQKEINFLQFGTGTIGADMGGVWLARCTVLVINLYIGVPYTMLMTSGILMNIPKDLYEAATIDGANKWQMFRKITLPYVIFVTTPYLISSFIGNITSFNTIFLTTGGGPSKGTGSVAGHTDLLVTWLYKLTMEDTKYNAGSIIGILTFLITAFITLVCYRNSKAYNEEDTFQ